MASIKDYQLLSLVGSCEAQPNVVSSSSFPCSVVFCWVPSKSAIGAFLDVMQAKQTPYLSYLQDTLQLVSLSFCCHNCHKPGFMRAMEIRM